MHTATPTISCFSPAKINLFLHITGKRADGYHNLQTVFRLLDWGDTLKFTLTNSHFSPDAVLHQASDTLPIQLSGNNLPTASLTDNLIYQASMALLRHAQHTNTLPETLPQITIHLTKLIPTGAGLGGGSSNASTTLQVLNELWQLRFSRNELCKIGATVGADVPIFVAGHDSIAEGIGEVLHPITLPGQQFLLLMPNVHVSTALLFGSDDLQRDCPIINVDDISAHQSDYVFNLNTPYQNVFEPIAVNNYPAIAQALSYLRQLESVSHSTARLTGTGSCVFLPFDEQYKVSIEKFVSSNKPPCRTVMTQQSHTGLIN